MDKLELIDFSKYTVTEDGKVISKTQNYNGHILTGSTNRDGYHTLCLRCKDNKSRLYYHHRVVWFYFNGVIPDGYEINHKDENKSNNSLCNLELKTRTDNIRYGTRTERASITNSIVQKGRKLTKEHIEKLVLAKSKPILQYNLKTNEPIRKWKNAKEIQKVLGYNSSYIGKCVRGLYDQAHGFGWKEI